MALYIRKFLVTGPIRFSVTAGQPAPMEVDRPFSTGPAGEFIRSGEGGHFFQDRAGAKEHHLPTVGAGRPRRPWTSYLPWASLALGILLVFLGVSVLMLDPNPAGWIEIALGLALIVGPFVVTARQRKELRERLARERAEQEEAERRRRELIGDYEERLARLSERYDETTLQELREIRESREIPHEEVAPLARRNVLLVGFDALSSAGPEDRQAIGELLDRAGIATGLTEDERHSIRLEIFTTLVWHLLADGRVDEPQLTALASVREALGLSAEEVERERRAVEEFIEIRDTTLESLPQVPPPIVTEFQELCHHVAAGTVVKPATTSRLGRKSEPADTPWKEGSPCEIVVTSRRVVLRGSRPREIPLTSIDQIELDADSGVLTIAPEDRDLMIHLRLPAPLFTGGVVDLMVANERVTEKKSRRRSAETSAASARVRPTA